MAITNVLSAISRLARPAAKAWARRGFFNQPDWTKIQPARVALVACHWIGDTFWASQTLPALKERFARSEFFVFTKSACLDLWYGQIEPQNVLPADAIVSDRRRERVSFGAISKFAKRFRAKDLDLVIDLTGNRYSALSSFLLRPGWALGFCGNELGWIYTHKVPNARRPGVHLSQQPFRVIEPLLAGTDQPFRWTDKPVTPALLTSCGDVRAELGLDADCRYAVLAPGAGWPAKRWPAERFMQVGRLIAQRDWRVIVIGSSAELALCERIAGQIPAGLCQVGRPLGWVIALLDQAGAVVCNDSGIGHLSAVMGRPTAVVFTSATNPDDCGPLGPEKLVKIFRQPVGPEGVVSALIG